MDFDWRRIEDNLIKLRPQTLKKINDVVVKAGHALAPKAIAAVRGDSFVVETNIHYPTESTLIGDGLRKILPLAAELAAENGLVFHRLLQPQALAQYEQFSLHWDGPPMPMLRQGTHRVTHPDIGEIDVFIVPIAQVAGAVRYEAVFSVHHETPCA